MIIALVKSFLIIMKFEPKQNSISIILLNIIYYNKFFFSRIRQLTNKFFKNNK